MRVLEEKVDAKLIQDRRTQCSTEKIVEDPSTFAEVVSQQNKSSEDMSKKSPTLQQIRRTNIKQQKINKGGATKSVELPAKNTAITNLETSAVDVENDQSGWKTVQYKKVNRQPKDVRVGTNTELTALQATERKKHLHVWRLHPETTLESITNHVKSMCGQDVSIKVDKIKHKTERDYSSCVIGVPEQWFDKLNQTEIWPINAEFNEWIWFRKHTKSTSN